MVFIRKKQIAGQDISPLDEKNSIKSLEELTCYCDGSYSYQTKIGYSGFRTSDGFNTSSKCPLLHPRNGSTESEVYAAYLALQHAAKCHCNKLILCTDNSKVEQLLKRPKQKDYKNYPKFFEALNHCQQKMSHINIEVKRVRGHTTKSEQEQCLADREFAKVDQQVRQKRRQYQRKCPSSNNIINLPFFLILNTDQN